MPFSDTLFKWIELFNLYTNFTVQQVVYSYISM